MKKMDEKLGKTQIKVALYTRVSTEDQARDGYSLSVQKDYLIEFAGRQGWEIHERDAKHLVYMDDGYSGYTLERPALEQLLFDARSKKFDLILVYKLDRFSRRLKDFLNVLDELDGLGVEFKSATEPYDTTTSSGKLMIQQLGSFAEFERNRIIERVVPGMVRGVQEGNWQGARYSPFGYRYDKSKKRLEVVSEEAGLVRGIFEKYISGVSTQKIAGELYQTQIRTRSGGNFNSSLVRKILRNKIYAGKIVWNKNHYDRKQKTASGYRYVKNAASDVIESQGKHEAIVSEEIFNQAQSILDRNRRGNFIRQRVWDYPLSGVIACANCGSLYNGVSNVKNHRTGEKRPYYRCSGRARHNIKCGNGDVRSELLEAQVFEILDTLFSAKEINTERLRNLVADQYRSGSTGKVVVELDQLKEELAGCHQKLSKLMDAYLDAMVSKAIFEQKNRELRNTEGELRIKIERMELQLVKREESEGYIRRAQTVVKSTQSVRENLHPVTRKEFLKLLFRKLEVKNQAVSNFELYEPFNAMYQKVLEERSQTNWNPSLTAFTRPNPKTQSCASRPSAVR